jgi:thiosulfate reductase cytochrome b subunit
MADSVFIPGLALVKPEADAPRHSLLVRVTHWINAVSFIGLVVSGFAIILAHPRFYWGETGGLGTPSLFDLPLPFLLGGPSGWGRYMHFQAAWLSVLNGTLYVASGIVNRHFRNNLMPAPRGSDEALSYSLLQRISYLAVIFLVFPLMIWTGLAMSPALTSVFPWLVTVLGGHQCARTIHFFAAVLLVAFVMAHVAMAWRAGFRKHVGAMITGRMAAAKENR